MSVDRQALLLSRRHHLRDGLQQAPTLARQDPLESPCKFYAGARSREDNRVAAGMRLPGAVASSGVVPESSAWLRTPKPALSKPSSAP